MKLTDIIRDHDIYPRAQISYETIESYVESLKAGAKFPPITVQRISSDGIVRTICLDGWHRLEAYREYNKLDGVEPIEEVEGKHWKDEVLDKEEHLVELMIKSFELNAKQGLRPSQTDAKSQLEKIARIPDSLNLVWKDIAKSFEVTPEWVSHCVSPILAGKRMSRDAFIYKLSLLGWTQKEIGEIAGGITQPEVSEIITKLNQLNPVIKSGFYEKHKSAEVIAEFYHLDLPLTWAILLEEKNDLDRLEELTAARKGHPLEIRPWDVWNYSKCDPLFGQQDYVGRVPGQLVINLLYFYTKQGDFIVDPMAGGGTTIDACLIMGRKCLAFDKEPTRPEVKKNNLLTDGFPALKHKCQLIFLDPPYYKKKEKEYGTESISALTRDDYLEFFYNLALDCKSNLSSKGRLALLMADFVDTKEYRDSIFGCDYANAFKKAGLHPMQHIQCPLSSESLEGSEVKRARDSRTIYIISRELIIFERFLE